MDGRHKDDGGAKAVVGGHGSPPATAATLFDFSGATYQSRLDRCRLNRQLVAVFSLMADGAWRTLREIADAVNAPEASVSARLRDLRKKRFGAWKVESRRRGEAARGLYEYRVTA